MDQAVRYLETISPHFEFYQCQSMLTKLGIADFDQKMGRTFWRAEKAGRYGSRTDGRKQPSNLGRADQPYG